MIDNTRTDLDKGGMAEEALRRYFLDLGAFVIRGVPIREGRETVTDIDLWIYSRTSVHTRNISIVDVKNKKRAKSFERAIWIKGLQFAVGANEAILAATNPKDSAAQFAARMGVRVLASNTLRAIMERYSTSTERLSSEELFTAWKGTTLQNAETARARVEAALLELAQPISFSTLNSWIDDAAAFLTAVTDRERAAGPLTRAAYLCTALTALGADYLGREVSFADAEMRRDYFQQGLVFGRAGANAGQSYVDFTEKMITEFLDPTGAGAAVVRSGFDKTIKALPVAGLIEFFSKPTAGRELFDAALALEAAAFAREVPRATELRPEAKAMIGLILDFAAVPRRSLLGHSRIESDDSVSTGSTSVQSALPLLEPRRWVTNVDK